MNHRNNFDTNLQSEYECNDCRGFEKRVNSLMKENAEMKAFISLVLHKDGFSTDSDSVRAIELINGIKIKSK